jgi:hypothetical protein
VRIAFIGSGHVGAPLAARLTRAGHDVTLAESPRGADATTRTLAGGVTVPVRPLASAVGEAEVVFLAIPFSANAALLPPVAGALAGKVLVDCTNPVGPGISHGLRSERSGAAAVQALAPAAKVVKAFSIYGYENFEDPSYPGYPMPPAMLHCGDDAEAKRTVARLIADCGFEPVDVGGLEQALHLEHMTLLWVRMVRMSGHSPHLVWGAMRRAG